MDIIVKLTARAEAQNRTKEERRATTGARSKSSESFEKNFEKTFKKVLTKRKGFDIITKLHLRRCAKLLEN